MPCKAINNQSSLDLSSHKDLLNSFFPYTQEKLGYDQDFSLNLQSDQDNSTNPLGKTAYYDPEAYEITIYVDGRHIKDIMRSMSHELVHHTQNCRGEFKGGIKTDAGYAQKDGHLRDMEKEAYLQGNMLFRDWEDNYKRDNNLKESKVMNISELRKLVQEQVQNLKEQDPARAPRGLDVNKVRRGAAKLAKIGRMAQSTLRKGSRGPKVKELQRALEMLGLLKSSDIDGAYGRITATAVTALQKSAGIGVDGVVGKHTWEALQQKVAQEGSGTRPGGTRTVEFSDEEGSTVRAGDAAGSAVDKAYAKAGGNKIDRALSGMLDGDRQTGGPQRDKMGAGSSMHRSERPAGGLPGTKRGKRPVKPTAATRKLQGTALEEKMVGKIEKRVAELMNEIGPGYQRQKRGQTLQWKNL
jgi:hypothetical protein